MRLHEITEAMIELQNIADNDELDDEILRDTFEGLDGAFEDKADQWARFIKDEEAEIDAIDNEIERLKAKKERKKNTVDKMRLNLSGYMRAANKTKFKTVLYNFGFRKSQAVEIVNEEDLPEWALIPQPAKVSKTEIKEHLKNGETVPGAKLVENESLQIR